MAKLGTLFDLFKQSRQGVTGRSVLEYDGSQQVTEDNDLVHKGYVDGELGPFKQLMPDDAEALTGKTLTVAGTTLRSGYIADDASHTNYEAGKGPGDSVSSYLLEDGNFTLSTPNTSTAINAGDKGALEAWVNGVMVDSFNLADFFNEANRTSAQTGLPANSPSGKVTVTSIEQYNGWADWQKVNARLNIASADLRTGHNIVLMKHTGLSAGEQVSQAFNFFYDNSGTRPSISAFALEIDTIVPKWLSGVKYLGLNSVISVDATVNAPVDNTYHANPGQLSSFHGMSTKQVAYNDASVSGLSSPPKTGEVMVVTAKKITLDVSNRSIDDARMTLLSRDPFGNGQSQQSASQKILVNTFGNTSTETKEYFNDEVYRQPLTANADDVAHPLTGQWDSTQLLGAQDALQKASGSNENVLAYRQGDFTGHLPANSANYSATGDVKHRRLFKTSTPKASVKLTLGGVAGGIGQLGSGDINVRIKLPGQTGWLDAAKPYDGAAGVGADGNGALVGSISYTGGNAVVDVTFGGKSTYDAGGRLWVEVIHRNGNREVKSLVTDW